jgi:hypothetical protein
MDAFFPSPLLPHFSFIAFLYFLLQGLTRGHCLGLVARADSVTHWYLCIEMIRLARDETPFPLAMQPKVTALAW